MTDQPPAVTASRAYAAFAIGCLFFAYAFVQRVSPSVMTTELMRDFAVGGAALGALSAMYLYPYALMQVPVGLLMDKYGPRPLLMITAVVCAIASYGFSTADTLFAASLGRGLIGVSVAFAFVGTLTIASAFFDRSRFALLSGILFSVGMLGAVAGQVPLRLLVDQLGWRGTYAVLAVSAAALVLLAMLCIPHRERAIGVRSASIRSGLLAVVCNAQNWLCAVIGFGLTAAMLSFAGLWAVPWMMMTLDYDARLAAAIATLIFVGWGIASPILGWYSDRLGARKPILIGGSLVALLAMAIIAYAPISSPTVLSVLFFIHGAGACSVVICFSVCRESNAETQASTAISLVNMCIVLGGAVMQPVIGSLLDWRWDGTLVDGARQYSTAAFDTALSILIVVLLVALVCSLCIRETWCKPMAADASKA